MKIALFLVVFLLIGAFFIVSNNNLYIGDSEQRAQFFESYYNWFVKMFSNGKSTTGYVVNLDWLP